MITNKLFLCCVIIVVPLQTIPHGNPQNPGAAWAHYNQQDLVNQREQKMKIAFIKIQAGMYCMGIGAACSLYGHNVRSIQWTVAGLCVWYSGLIQLFS